MTTTSATSSTPTTASVTQSATKSLLDSLDAGSGVDTSSLVTSLVDAQFAAKKAQLTAKYETLTSQISGVSTLKSMIGDFADALAGLVKGGTLQSQPVSGNTAVFTASAITGAKLSGLTATIGVTQLASAQTAVSATAFASSSATVGTGTLTLKLGSATFDTGGAMTGFTAGAGEAIDITIDDSNSSLTGIAAAINAKKAGVTASVVTNADGSAYLSLKGATGAAQAFTLEASSTTGDLSKVAVGPGATAMSVTSQAKNAKLTMDGVAIERASNEISDLVEGVKLTLTGTSPVAVSLTTSTPTGALTNAVNDFVETYNGVFAALKEQTDPITGELRADPAAKDLLRNMQALASRVLLPDAAEGEPATLAQLGVRTNRDGTLSVDADALTKAITDHPASVEAIFSFSTVSGTGLNQAMASIKLNATSTLYGLGASTTRYLEAQGRIADQQDAIEDKAASMTTRMTQQFASMNSRVSAYKATQAFMQQQIDAWTKSDS
ncbi:flagellar filament capping protein FliD [Sphingomonas sp.]|uniref:flagellar filament capping protein FliD n=1 Tax=Sphingomonas sp. TaxID=28214 RepID=UPI0035C7C116